MAIPKGTLMAIFWTTVSYLVLSATIGNCSGLRPHESGWWAAGEAPLSLEVMQEQSMHIAVPRRCLRASGRLGQPE